MLFLSFLIVLCISCSVDAVCKLSDAEPNHGEATYYDWADRAAAGEGSCMYDTGGDLNVAAINDHQYESGKLCGMCVEVTGPTGNKSVVQIVDMCTTCEVGDLDLSKDGFDAISGGGIGRVEITWIPVECPVQDKKFSYIFVYANENANSAFQMRIFNHRHPILSLERFHEFEGDAAEWFTLPRGGHGNFGVPKGYRNLEAPFMMRITSNASGEIIEESMSVAPVNDGTGFIVASDMQFYSICGSSVAALALATQVFILCLTLSVFAF